MSKWVRALILGSIFLTMSACLGSGENVASAELGLRLNASTFYVQRSTETNVVSSDVAGTTPFQGELLVRNIDTDQTSTFFWSAEIDADTMTTSSNRTIILKPGNYELSLLLSTGNQQYAGTTITTITDGQNDVAMTVHPIIGGLAENVTVVSRTAAFRLHYDPVELRDIQYPHVGVKIDGGSETILTLNSATGSSDAIVNVTPGLHNIALLFYDGWIQVGRSRPEQETVIVSTGQNITMDFVALQGQVNLNLTDAGGDANFTFLVPPEVVEEAGGTDNLLLTFSVAGPANPFQERFVPVVQTGARFVSSATLSGMRYGDVTFSFSFFDTSTTPRTLLGTCNQDLTLDARSRTAACNISLLRRGTIGGNLLATVGVDVVDTMQRPVSGAAVSSDGHFIGTTTGAFGTPGFLTAFLRTGTHTLTAVSGGRQGSQIITVDPLSISNVRIILSAAPPAVISGTIVDGATNALVASQLQVTVEGPDRDLVIDANGTPVTSFSVTDGTLGFQVAANVTPSEIAPVNITLVVTGDNFVSTNLPMTIVAATTEFSLKMADLRGLPPGVVGLLGGATSATVEGATMSAITTQSTEPVTNVTVKVTVPEGTIIKDKDGVPLSGTLTMQAVYFSPTVDKSLATFPGGFSVEPTDTSGTPSPGEFVTAGMMAIEITSGLQRAKTMKTRSGEDAMQIIMGISPTSINPGTGRHIALGDVIPVFSGDTTTGQWVEEGTATITMGEDGKLVAVFNAGHLSLWNLDFKVNRCDNPGYHSRRISLVQAGFGAIPLCAAQMRALRLRLTIDGGRFPLGWIRYLQPVPAPTDPNPNLIEFINAPQFSRFTITIFQDRDGDGLYNDMIDFRVGEHTFDGLNATGNGDDPENDICPHVTDTAIIHLSAPTDELPGGSC